MNRDVFFLHALCSASTSARFYPYLAVQFLAKLGILRFRKFTGLTMRPSQFPMRSQISTMPRQKTAAAAYLDLYKLTTEQTRLQQELVSLEQRRDRVMQRLAVLNQQTAALEITAQPRATQPHPAQSLSASNLSEGFTTFYLEY